MIEYLTGKIPEAAERNEGGRILGIGSIIHLVKPGDIVFGSGTNRKKFIDATGARFISVRGPITRKFIVNAEVPEIYGDPAILLPRIYSPKVEKKYRIGYIPHYVDKPFVPGLLAAAPEHPAIAIDIQADWKIVIDLILQCDRIIASSLHGIIAAEAYGIPAEWAVWGTKIRGGPIKYHDYFLGTGRGRQKPFTKLPPIPDLSRRQDALDGAFREAFPG